MIRWRSLRKFGMAPPILSLVLPSETGRVLSIQSHTVQVFHFFLSLILDCLEEYENINLSLGCKNNRAGVYCVRCEIAIFWLNLRNIYISD